VQPSRADGRFSLVLAIEGNQQIMQEVGLPWQEVIQNRIE
jgi:hypothetical protein